MKVIRCHACAGTKVHSQLGQKAEGGQQQAPATLPAERHITFYTED